MADEEIVKDQIEQKDALAEKDDLDKILDLAFPEVQETPETQEEQDDKLDDSELEELEDDLEPKSVKQEPTEEEKIKAELEQIKAESQKAKQLEEEVKKTNSELERTREEARVLQENNLKIAQIDTELSKLTFAANQIIEKNQLLQTRFNQGYITTEEYTKEYAIIHNDSAVLAAKYNNLEAQKKSIPSIEQYRQIEEVKTKNKEYFNKTSIKDDLLKSHLDKAKKDYFDDFGVPLEDNPAWKKVSEHLSKAISDGEKRGYQKAIEKIQERTARGKFANTPNTQGKTRSKNPTLDELAKMSSEELLKYF